MDKWEQDFRCDKCGHPIEEEYGLCDACWEKYVGLGNKIHE
jgi:predicted amidophosphoribosyltransferase